MLVAGGVERALPFEHVLARGVEEGRIGRLGGVGHVLVVGCWSGREVLPLKRLTALPHYKSSIFNNY